MNITKKIRFWVLLLFTIPIYGQHPKVGLCFLSHKYNIDQRTSLILNNNQPYVLDKDDDFVMEFDVFLRNEKIKFGYIFRIISNKDENFDFIVNNELKTFLVVNKQDFLLKNVSILEQWAHITIVFNKKQNVISLRFNDETVNCLYDLKETKSLNISFGECDFKNFQTNDVAPIILKNVRIHYNNKELHYWILDRHGENVVYDALKNRPAIVRHPQWAMDKRIFWEKIAEIQSSLFPQIAFDSIRNNIYILKQNELICYSLSAFSEQRIKCQPEIQGKFYNHLMYDPNSSRLFFYSIEKKQNYFYNFETNNWTNYQPDEDEPTHAHQNRYISTRDSSLYLFGGYGFYKYNSDFFKIDLKSNERAQYDFSSVITPRYLAAMGGNTTGDKVYILGGHGAEMGRQELAPENFSDLFEVDLKTLTVKYLFDIDRDGDKGNVYSNNLVADEENKNLYVLAYPNKTYTSSICLKQINLETQKVVTLADSIEFYFQDITSFCDLYYSKQLSKLIAIVSFSRDRKTSSINIYTLDYPPLTSQDVIQHKIGSSFSWLFYLAALLVLLSIVLFIFGKKIKEKIINHEKTAGEIDDEFDFESEEDAENVQKEKAFYNTKNKSILFLGGFQVFDKKGRDITGEFTPTLKYLVVILLLYSLKSSKGISSAKLQELLWFGKTEESARNNRNVNVSKLRVLLYEVGNIDIANKNGYWTLSLPEDILSDYKEVMQLVHTIQNEAITNKEDLLHIVELLNSGSILPNIQAEWLDNFKTDFTDAVIDTLMYVVSNHKNPFYDDLDIRVKIADSLLKMDSINEEAIGIKCKALMKLGKKGLAKTTFDNFSREYKLLLGESYAGSIKNFLD